MCCRRNPDCLICNCSDSRRWTRRGTFTNDENEAAPGRRVANPPLRQIGQRGPYGRSAKGCSQRNSEQLLPECKCSDSRRWTRRGTFTNDENEAAPGRRVATRLYVRSANAALTAGRPRVVLRETLNSYCLIVTAQTRGDGLGGGLSPTMKMRLHREGGLQTRHYARSANAALTAGRPRVVLRETLNSYCLNEAAPGRRVQTRHYCPYVRSAKGCSQRNSEQLLPECNCSDSRRWTRRGTFTNDENEAAPGRRVANPPLRQIGQRGPYGRSAKGCSQRNSEQLLPDRNCSELPRGTGRTRQGRWVSAPVFTRACPPDCRGQVLRGNDVGRE